MRRALLLLAPVFVMAGSAPGAQAAGPQWLPAQPIEQNQNAISGLSCPSATTCLAASSNPVVQDNGPSFEQNPDPGSSLNAVSCAPGTRFCMFVDNNGGAFAYTNGVFDSPGDIDGNVEIDGVSCPSGPPASFCMAIDHNNKVFKYSNGSWDSGTTLIAGAHNTSGFLNISCATSQFCVALVGTDDGVLYYTWQGSGWSSASTPFDVNASHMVSLSCTSTTFCLATDDIGNALVFNGSWSSPHRIDMYNAQPILYSACVAMSCVAVDYFGGFFHSSDGSTWTGRASITDTSISGVESLTCATATLCVAGDGVGSATTYAVAPAAGKPKLSGTPGVGHVLALSHAQVQTSPVWYADDWRRCSYPDSACTAGPISRSQTGYTLMAADTHRYIDVRELAGFGFDEEGPLVSNVVGPIAPKPGTVKLASATAPTHAGVAAISLRCTGGPCKGTVRLSYRAAAIGTARYSIAAGQTAKVRITLNTAGKNQLRHHRGTLPVKLVITPAAGPVINTTVTLKQQ